MQNVRVNRVAAEKIRPKRSEKMWCKCGAGRSVRAFGSPNLVTHGALTWEFSGADDGVLSHHLYG
jgi:hypothetical protein